MFKKLLVGIALCMTASFAFFTGCTEDCAHEYGEWEVKEPATCQELGSRSRTCTLCGQVQNEEIQLLEHDWKEGEVFPATCTEDGSISSVCKNCGERKDSEVQPALGHEGEWKTITEPTCTEKGTDQIVCTREGCGKTESRDIDELGHSWGMDFIIEVEPTSTQEGSMYRSCDRCPEKDVQSIPKFDESLDMEYTVTLLDPVGDIYRGNATVAFYDGTTLVKESSKITRGVSKLKLGQKNYKVKVSGLSAGYFATEEEYDINGRERQLKIVLGASLNKEAIPQNTLYSVGSVLYDFDFSYFDENGATKSSSLEAVLNTKKGILLNFYYYNCGYCRSEMPALISTIRTYQDDIQVIMVNTQDEDSIINRFQSDFNNPSGIWFMNKNDSRTMLSYFNVSGTPTSFFIDCNGQLVSSQSGEMSASGFNGAFLNLVTRYETLHPTAAETIDFEAVLPSKNQIFE